MGTLANISSTEAIHVFQKLGYRFERQRGSHKTFAREGVRKILSIPDRRELSVGTLRTLIRDANLTVDEFLALL